MLYPEPSTTRQIAAYLAAVPVAVGVAATLRYLLAPLRRSNVVARFVARVAIIGVFYATFAAVMVGIAGPYVFARASTSGSHTSPTDRREILKIGLAAGVLGAIVWPMVARAKGRDGLGM